MDSTLAKQHWRRREAVELAEIGEERAREGEQKRAHSECLSNAETQKRLLRLTRGHHRKEKQAE
jgi:hypothetical protein